jgi:hypothetical protein
MLVPLSYMLFRSQTHHSALLWDSLQGLARTMEPMQVNGDLGGGKHW